MNSELVADFRAPGVQCRTFEVTGTREETFEFLLRSGRECSVQEFSQRYQSVADQGGVYEDLLKQGVANECARAFLRRDEAPSRMFVLETSERRYLHDMPGDVFLHTHSVEGVADTPGALIAYCARVSSSNPKNSNIKGLLNYCRKHHHWSPFEQEWMGVRMIAPQYVAHQLVRHRTGILGGLKFLGTMRQELRRPGATSRQASLSSEVFKGVPNASGLVGEMCRFVFSAPIRTWIHLLQVRESTPEAMEIPEERIKTQKECYTALRTYALPAYLKHYGELIPL